MEEARELYEQALAIVREAGNRRVEGIVLGNLATVHQEQGRMEEARELYEQALAIDREVGNRRFEGIVLGNLASWDLLATGDQAKVLRSAGESETLFRDLGDKFELGNLLCIRGHVRLAGGRGAGELLREVEGISMELAAREDSELGKAIAKLRRAQAAFDAGKPLVCGYVRGELTEGQLRWLAQHRPEALEG